MIDLSSEFYPIPKVFKPKKIPKGIRKIGKKSKLNLEANVILKSDFQRMGITRCEVQLNDCWGVIQGFAHGKKRRDLTLAELKKFAIGSCNACHHKIEYECEKWTGMTMEQFVRMTIKNRTP